MRYIKLGITYMFKNFGYIALAWLLPAVFFGLCISPFQMLEFVGKYPSTVISSFSNIFDILMPISWLKVFLAILGILLVAVFASFVFGEMESHMRSGKLGFKNIFSFVNNNIMVVAINILLLAVIYAVLVFLLGSILFLFHLMFSGLSNLPTTLNVIFAIIFVMAVLALYTLIALTFLINIPNMISNGYSFKEGISSTLALISRNAFKLLCAYLVPYIVVIPLVCCLTGTAGMWAVNMACSFIVVCYQSSLTMTSYFELSDTPRYDNRKYYSYNK